MTADGRYTAVLDRFEPTEERDVAVLLLEQDGDLVDDLAVARDDLPEEARHQDAVLAVRVEDGEIVEADYRRRRQPVRNVPNVSSTIFQSDRRRTATNDA